jgi:hypothetical protein
LLGEGILISLGRIACGVRTSSHVQRHARRMRQSSCYLGVSTMALKECIGIAISSGVLRRARRIVPRSARGRHLLASRVLDSRCARKIFFSLRSGHLLLAPLGKTVSSRCAREDSCFSFRSCLILAPLGRLLVALTPPRVLLDSTHRPPHILNSHTLQLVLNPLLPNHIHLLVLWKVEYLGEVDGGRVG